MKKVWKILIAAAAVAAAATAVIHGKSASAEGFDKTAMEMAQEMGAGWNLGNSLDAYDENGGNETAWGNPEVTPELIHSVKEAGFETIRIPVSYMNHIGEAPDYTIDSDFLDRVQEVVDYAIGEDLYVVIDVHHDGNHDTDYGAWLMADADNQEEIEAKFEKVWEQLAARFKSYDDHLLFESMNEIGENGNYGEPQYDSTYENINSYNQIFVDTVRASGGNNAERFLIVPGYNTNIEYTAGDYGFAMPADTAKDKLIVSVHYYDPYDFTLNEGNDAVYAWGEAAVSAGSAVDYHTEETVDASMQQLKERFTDNGIPVFVGEYGAIDKTSYNSENEEYRRYYYEYVSKAVHDIGGVSCCWDNGWAGDHGFALFDRATGEVLHQDIIDGIMRSVSGEDYTIQVPENG